MKEVFALGCVYIGDFSKYAANFITLGDKTFKNNHYCFASPKAVLTLCKNHAKLGF